VFTARFDRDVKKHFMIRPKESKEIFGRRVSDTSNRFTTKDGCVRNITHNMHNSAV
jgi:hypothetical protein